MLFRTAAALPSNERSAAPSHVDCGGLVQRAAWLATEGGAILMSGGSGDVRSSMIATRIDYLSESFRTNFCVHMPVGFERADEAETGGAFVSLFVS